jgi:uncharacterized protein
MATGMAPLANGLDDATAPLATHRDDPLSAFYPRFNLTLMVNHACNMACDYCYLGHKSGECMAEGIGWQAIDRALASVEPGGVLELGFFGGEPLLDAGLVDRLADYAVGSARTEGIRTVLSLTTNGTMSTSDAWRVMMRPDLHLAISHDGLPDVHNEHRRYGDGCGTSARVLRTVHRLIGAGKEFSVVMVVRPDTVAYLPAGIEFLHALGVRRVEPSLDLWTPWSREDLTVLEDAIAAAAAIWRDALPDLGVTWFDEKAAAMAHVQLEETARCRFGNGQVAVSPSGHLYPCERLIGQDTPANPARLRGHVAWGDDFLSLDAPCPTACEACETCRVQSVCNTTCPCSNYVRTGDPGRPDGLLCLFNRACARETARVLLALDQGARS